jgi:LysM repeat protein
MSQKDLRQGTSEDMASDEGMASDRPITFLGRLKGLRWLGWVFLVVVVAAVIWVVQHGTISIPVEVTSLEEAEEVDVDKSALMNLLPISLEQLPIFSPYQADRISISRDVNLHTVFPERPRIEITQYEVKEGDNLFGISEKFNLKPETILWGNWYTLNGDPHTLRAGQKLKILPVNGVLHIWSQGEGLNGVAEYYGVTADDIINWPGNHLDPSIDRANPPIEPGTELVVPNGQREAPSWQMVRITRSDPAVAKVLGPGYCGAISSGLIGDGVFGWPAPSTWISGYDYIPNVHEAIDIGGSIGMAIYAADDGVVVYSGWNDWGYGYVIVLDHGNGWQTLYAHLSEIYAGCGQSVSQGETIGLMGVSGNSTGPHLHFEMRNDVWGRVNPHNFLP